jgi:hypothetical protein
MDFPPSPEFDLFVEDDGLDPELNFQLDADSSMWMDESSSSRVDESCDDESQDFFDIDLDFDLLDGTELLPLLEDSENAFEMELDLEESESTSHSDSEMSVDSEFDTFLRTSKWHLFLLTKFSCRNSPSVVQCIEDMVLAFLTQLAHPDGARTRRDSDDLDPDSCPSPASKTLPKIELALVNRGKSGSGRYVDFILLDIPPYLEQPSDEGFALPKENQNRKLETFW